jgi:hypothetical protein
MAIKKSQLYSTLCESCNNLRAFVVDKKWLKALRQKFYNVQDNAVPAIISRVQTLRDRYAETLPQLETNEKRLEKEVGQCLKQMGYQLT